MMSIGQQALAEEFKAARIASGLSLRDLAAQVGADFTTISHIEAGRTVPSIVLTSALATALGLDVQRCLRHRWMHVNERFSGDLEQVGFVIDWRDTGGAYVVPVRDMITAAGDAHRDTTI